jgi:prepilin-type N-terminal cleavage/methylation domain-containing protein
MSVHPHGQSEWQRGFSLIELLVALGIVMSIGAVAAQLVPTARVAFDRVPADLDLQQRGRTAVDVLSQALRSAGRNVAATTTLGQLSELLPTVYGSDPTGVEGMFRAITVVVPVVEGAQGVLNTDQTSPGALISLGTSPCPNFGDVCGFAPGTTAMIASGDGIHDVFVVGTTMAGARWLMPNHGLSRAYPAGSVIVEVDEHTFRLADQANGSMSLIRVTAVGAVQPIVDFVADLSFDVQGEDTPAGFFRPRQVGVSIRMQAQTESTRRMLGDRVFKTAIRLRNAS